MSLPSIEEAAAKKMWVVWGISEADDIHITPAGDLMVHALSRKCSCKPGTDADDDRLVIHNALDGRK